MFFIQDNLRLSFDLFVVSLFFFFRFVFKRRGSLQLAAVDGILVICLVALFILVCLCVYFIFQLPVGEIFVEFHAEGVGEVGGAVEGRQFQGFALKIAVGAFNDVVRFAGIGIVAFVENF